MKISNLFDTLIIQNAKNIKSEESCKKRNTYDKKKYTKNFIKDLLLNSRKIVI